MEIESENNFFDLKQSEWQCYLFGSIGNSGIVWRPAKGGHPNPEVSKELSEV